PATSWSCSAVLLTNDQNASPRSGATGRHGRAVLVGEPPLRFDGNGADRATLGGLAGGGLQVGRHLLHLLVGLAIVAHFKDLRADLGAQFAADARIDIHGDFHSRTPYGIRASRNSSLWPPASQAAFRPGVDGRGRAGTL